MTGLLKSVIACFLLITLKVVSYAQDIATWKGNVVIAPAKEIPDGNGMVEIVQESSTTLELSLQQDGTWAITFDSENGHSESGDSNGSHQPLSLLLKMDTFDSALTINGTLSPDSSTINCTVIKGSSKTNLVLHRTAPPVSWGGDTTINGNRTIINLTYKNDPSWKITLQNDSIGSQESEVTNDEQPPQISFMLASTFVDNSSGRHFEGILSPDSSSIAGTLFMNDSVKVPITLYKGKKGIEKFNSDVHSASSRSLWWRWAIGWAVISTVVLLFFGLRKKSSSISTDASVIPPADDWLKKILPIVRISCKKIFPGKRKALIIFIMNR